MSEKHSVCCLLSDQLFNIFLDGFLVHVLPTDIDGLDETEHVDLLVFLGP